MKSSARSIYLDIARVSGSLAVVMLHVASLVLTQPEVTLPNWIWANLYNSMTRWSVPVFIMISGALFLPLEKKVAWLAFYQKRMQRLVLPITFWTLIYFGWWSLSKNTPFSLDFFGQVLVFDQPFEHLYFLLVITWLYLFTPFLRYLKSKLRSRGQLLIAAVLILLGWIWPQTRFIGTFWVPFLAYYWIGGIVSAIAVPNSFWRNLFYLFLVATAFIAVGTYYLTWVLQATHNLFFYDFYQSPLVLVASVSLFMSIKGGAELKNTIYMTVNAREKIHEFASYTLGIYLVHPLFLNLFVWLGAKTWLTSNAFITIPFMSLVLWLVSLVFVSVIKRIPVLNKAV